MRCLAKHPERRFSSVQALAQALYSEQSESASRILKQIASGNVTEQHQSFGANHSINSTSYFFELQQKFRNIQQWIRENSRSDKIYKRFRSLTKFEPMSAPSSGVSYSFSPTAFTLSAVNLELINHCQAELAIYIGPIAELIIERTLKNDAHYYQT